MTDSNERRIQLSGMWLETSKAGEQYFTGSLGRNGKLLMFKNKKKEPNTNQPDWNLYLVPMAPKQAAAEPSPDDMEMPF